MTLSLLALLAALTMTPQERMVRHTAEAMGVDADFAACVVRHESEWDPAAIGDQGRAVGLFQWHRPSWRHVRRAMGLSIEDRRHDARESTVTALWAMNNGYADWWTATAICR